MFTVKTIDNKGNENVLDAISVHAKASERPTPEAPYTIEAVSFQTSDGADIEISGQGSTVYVMNNNGKTVSKYLLGINNGEVGIGIN